MKYKSLFKPILINKLMLNNRIIAAPLTDGAELPEKMRSGAAVNIMGSIRIDHHSANWYGSLYPFCKEEKIKTRNKLNYYKQGGSYVSAELMHCGLWNRGEDVFGPNDEINQEGVKVKALTIEELDEIVESFARTATDAKNFGFDMITLHFAHGWLITQFLSPAMNHRMDEYGGSYENRVRFPLKCIKAIRNAVGPDYPIDMRISAYEWIDNSTPFEDVLHFIQDCEPYIDMVNISAGLDMDKKASVHLTASQFEGHCVNIKYSRKVKENVSIPVCVVGSIMTPSEANEIIEKGYADMVAIGRPLLADPYWIKKAYEGNDEDIVPCIRCTNCLHWSTERNGQHCSVNIRAFKDSFVPENIEKAAIKKKVMIIGGGPAGMKAALVSKLRGHDVVLYEKENVLGGLTRYADYDKSKQDLKRLKDYLIRQVMLEDIDVHLNSMVTLQTVQKENPDELIIAIGSSPFLPKIKGVEYASQALDVYPHLLELPDQIVIVGGGTIGCELALELTAKGKNVVILEMTNRLHKQDSLYYDIIIDQCIKKESNLKCLTSVKVLEIKPNEVIYEDENGQLHHVPSQSTIIAAGLRSRLEEAHSFYQLDHIKIHMIGDCVKVGKVKDANESAYFTSANI